MKKISTFALGLMLASAAFAQKSNNNTTIPTFQEAMGKYFLVGAAVNTSLTSEELPGSVMLLNSVSPYSRIARPFI